MKEIIPFKKQRDVGAVLTDTFTFMRLNFKPLFSAIFKYAGPALIGLILSFVLYIRNIGGMDFFSDDIQLFQGQLLWVILLLLIAAIIFYGMLYSTLISYIASYEKNKGIIDDQEIKNGVKTHFWGVIGLSFLVGLITIFGIVLCVIPGIYLGTVLASTFAILILDKKGVLESIGYSFELIKGEWWTTFATLFVMGIIYYFIMLIGQVPQYIYFFAKAFVVAETNSLDPSAMFDWGYTILSVIGMIIQYLAQTLLIITTVFIYYNLNEKKNFTGTLESIESLGKRT